MIFEEIYAEKGQERLYELLEINKDTKYGELCYIVTSGLLEEAMWCIHLECSQLVAKPHKPLMDILKKFVDIFPSPESGKALSSNLDQSLRHIIFKHSDVEVKRVMEGCSESQLLKNFRDYCVYLEESFLGSVLKEEIRLANKLSIIRGNSLDKDSSWQERLEAQEKRGIVHIRY